MGKRPIVKFRDVKYSRIKSEGDTNEQFSLLICDRLPYAGQRDVEITSLIPAIVQRRSLTDNKEHIELRWAYAIYVWYCLV